MEKYLGHFYFPSSKIIPVIPANRTPTQQAAAAANLHNPNFRRKEIDNSPNELVEGGGHQSRLVSNITCHSYSDNNNNKNTFLVEFGEISFNNN